MSGRALESKTCKTVVAFHLSNYAIVDGNDEMLMLAIGSRYMGLGSVHSHQVKRQDPGSPKA